MQISKIICIFAVSVVVAKDVPPYAIVGGVPAEVKKYRFDAPTIAKLQEKEWWNGSEEDLKKVGEMEFRVGEYINPSVLPSNTSISV